MLPSRHGCRKMAKWPTFVTSRANDDEAHIRSGRAHKVISATGSTRRFFLKLAASSAAAGGVVWSQNARSDATTPRLPAPLPKSLDGELLLDSANREAATGDFGYQIYRRPLAVLKPASVDDVIRTIAYANKHGIKVAMRGQGHCLYGQSQVDSGIVIDSSTLSRINLLGDEACT